MRSHVEEIFIAVVDLSAEARAKYFARHDIDADTRSEVEALVAADGASDTRLAREIGFVANVAMEQIEVHDLRCGAYKLGDFLGRGGMGTVYLAERVDGEVAHRAAVKLLRPCGDNSQQRQRFLAERQILAGLNHPNIARLLDAGHREDGQPYLVMDYVQGKPIDVYASGLSLRERVALFLKVCAAVGYLHRNLVVHRDLKPANILVTAEGEPKLLDFGIAKMLDVESDSTATAVRMLTPDYASPEQVSGGPVSTATDIYSLGAVLYKLLTGRSPHQVDGDSAAAMALVLGGAPITPPSKLAPVLKGDLECILLKALRREPQERYATTEQFADDLESYLELRPVRARTGEAWYRTRKFIRRYWVPVTAVLVAAVSLSAGLIIAHRQRDVARRQFDQVRLLASELFTIESDIRQLAGSTQARERIVKTALQYLERLSKEAGNDLGLKEEIASAYTKVANIQGGFRSENLGHPAEARASLQRAESFFREISKARPKDAEALRSYLKAVELRSRIEYGQLHLEGLEETLRVLRELVARYELLAPATPDAWDFLGGIYQTMSVAAGQVNRRLESLEWGAQSVAYQRKALAASSEVRFLGNLSASLANFGRMQRSAGDVDGALRTTQQTIEISERLVREHPTSNPALLNLSTQYAYIASTYAEEQGVSLGNPDEAIRWYDRAVELCRRITRANPQEAQMRHNLANMTREMANLMRHRDGARAAELYDESIAALRGLPADAAGRNVQLAIVLAESTFALRALGRVAVARDRLKEARRLAEATKDLAPEAPEMPPEAIVRAEADWALAEGRADEAAALQVTWLKQMHFGASSVRKDLHSAVIFGAHYGLLSEAYRKAGRKELAAQAEAKRQEVLGYWQQQIPNSSRIAWSCCAAGTGGPEISPP